MLAIRRETALYLDRERDDDDDDDIWGQWIVREIFHEIIEDAL